MIKFGIDHSLVKCFQVDTDNMICYPCFEDFFDGIQNCHVNKVEVVDLK